MLNKRTFLTHGAGGALGLALAAKPGSLLAQGIDYATHPPLIPILARPDRIFRVTVCTRPFRGAGPRIEVEQIAGKPVVHHYGHGGSGWSLSWGSAQQAVPLALAQGQPGSANEIAVVGAGAIGLTTAITAQRMGAKVTIYAKARFPQTASSWATGGWTPNSRIAMEGEAAPDFAERWERMARAAFTTHQSFLGLAGAPVEWVERYQLSDSAAAGPPFELEPPTPGRASRRFVNYDALVADLTPHREVLAPGTHPFPAPVVRRGMSLTFNVADLCRQLETDFQIAGGRFVPMELHEAADFGRLREPVVINCTGYAARALLGDESVVPVRGQIAWLIPQPGVSYGVGYKEKGLSVLARRDGIVVQPIGHNDFYGFDDANAAPDLAQARADVELAATFLRGAPRPPY